jgi:hypothetical protein
MSYFNVRLEFLGGDHGRFRADDIVYLGFEIVRLAFEMLSISISISVSDKSEPLCTIYLYKTCCGAPFVLTP